MADDDDAALYGDLDEAAPKLASEHELSTQLTAVVREREHLEAKLEALKAENISRRDAIQDLTRRACIMLTTARTELQRKNEQLGACRQREAGGGVR